MPNRIIELIERWLENLASVAVVWASRLVLWPRWAKRGLVISGDVLLCFFAVWLAFSLRLGEWRFFDWPVVRFALSALIVWIPVAYFQGIYSAIFRYSGRGAIVRLALAVGLTTLPLIYFYMFRTYPGVPRTIAVMGPMVFFLMMTLARIVGRYVLIDLFHSRPVGGLVRRVLIYGAGAVGQRLAASLASEPGMQLISFIDDDISKKNQRLDGARVYHSSQIEQLVERTGVTDILLAMSHAGFSRRREIMGRLEPLKVNVRTLPPMRDILEGKISADALRPIKIEDLLGRTPVAPDHSLLSKPVTGQRVVISGAGGSIGSEICRQIIPLRPAKIVLIDFSEFGLFSIEQEIAETAKAAGCVVEAHLLDLKDRKSTERLFARINADTVFHAAAYKHVPLVEENVVAGIENNVFGTRNIVDSSHRNGVKRFILVSTDKAVRPPNIMGATKRVCEMIVQSKHAAQNHEKDGATIFTMVRFGNVLGSSGSVVPLFEEQIARGGPVTLTHREVTRYFMTIPEAAQLVIQAGGMSEGGEVFVLEMGEPVKIFELAKSMIRLAGLSVRDSNNPDGEVAIHETGLRPGEKLFEELLIGDDAKTTSHPRIMMAQDSLPPQATLDEVFDGLIRAVEHGDPAASRKLLAQLVPTLQEPAKSREIKAAG